MNPEQTSPCALTCGIGKSHFGKAWIHYVFAMIGTVEPPLHDFLDGLRTVGNVFAYQFFPIANRTNPIRGRASGWVHMFEIVVFGHVARMPERDTRERFRQSHWWRRSE